MPPSGLSPGKAQSSLPAPADDLLRPRPRRSSTPSSPRRSQCRSSPSCRPALVGLIHPSPHSLLSRLFFLLILVLAAATPVAAVRVPFTNCLSDSYRFNDPTPLQWVPLYADATFDTLAETHNLRLIVWGNVTGAQNQGLLPPPDDAYWRNDNESNGKIVDVPDPDAVNRKATTLSSRVNVLTYEPWNRFESFCRGGLVNASCPLGPIFSTDNLLIPEGLPSINLSHNFFSTYSFSSFSATLLILFGDARATNIGCVSATITPDLGSLSPVLTFLPLIVLLFSGFAVIFASIFSPWGTTDLFRWTSNYGRDADLLRLITPGFGDCLQHLQFIVLTGALTLSYPGYYQPVVSKMAWSSLMFNQSFATGAPSWQSVVDGIYVTNATYGLQELGQLVGMAEPADIWAGMMVWLCVIIAALFFLLHAAYLFRWLWRKAKSITEEDLRAKNIPFAVGILVRLLFSYMLTPIIALSAFQLVTASRSPAYIVVLAALTLALIIGTLVWILLLVIRTRPKSVLFDDLPALLRYGPLYNTYSDEAAAFALVPALLNVIRGFAIGAVQPSGVAQVVLLAICEVIQIFTLNAFRPFYSATSMNAYHTIFSALRLLTILLMVAFAPSLGVTEGPKGWIGYAILLLHAILLILGFFLSALQTMVEVVARMLGAGGDDVGGQTRGGLSKIFGMRQLSRRETHRPNGSRASQLSTTAMLAAENGSRTGYAMPGGRVRSTSTASFGGIISRRDRSSSALESIDVKSNGRRKADTSSSYMPGTPGDAGTFSFGPSAALGRQSFPPGGAEASDPYYRPPRRRRDTAAEIFSSEAPPPPRTASLVAAAKQAHPQPPLASEEGGEGEEEEEGEEEDEDEEREAGEAMIRSSTPAPTNATANATANGSTTPPLHRPDYSTREVDFYYGVRGPALNSDGPGRKLGTGPADPTGPVATATGWFRNLFTAKTKDKGKGFEVVRSSRMPSDLMRNGGFGDETPPEGIPVAMGVLRNGPIDSDDDEPQKARRSIRRQPGDLLTDEGEARVSDPDEPASLVVDEDEDDEGDDVAGRKILAGEGGVDDGSSPPSRAGEVRRHGGEGEKEEEDDFRPAIPRKSSKRSSTLLDANRLSAVSLGDESVSGPPSDPEMPGHGPRAAAPQPLTLELPSTLLFERTGSEKRLSSTSSIDFSRHLSRTGLGGDGPGEAFGHREADGRPKDRSGGPAGGLLSGGDDGGGL